MATKCQVCKKKIDDTYEHVQRHEDQVHHGYFMKLRDCNWELPCYCGGHISTRGQGYPDGGASWETSCDQCGLVYDED